MALRPSTDRRATAKRGSPPYSTEHRETVRSGLRIPARMTVHAHPWRQESRSVTRTRSQPSFRPAQCRLQPGRMSNRPAVSRRAKLPILSWGPCIYAPEGALPQKCFLFTARRGLFLLRFKAECTNLHTLPKKSDSLYIPRTVRTALDPCRPHKGAHT